MMIMAPTTLLSYGLDGVSRRTPSLLRSLEPVITLQFFTCLLKEKLADRSMLVRAR